MSTAYNIPTRVNSQGNTTAELSLVEASTNLDLSAHAIDPETGLTLAIVYLAEDVRPEVVVEIAAKMVRTAMLCTSDPDALLGALQKHLKDP